jgi:hypothetical protein
MLQHEQLPQETKETYGQARLKGKGKVVPAL